MKKFIITAIAIALAAVLTVFGAMQISAENESTEIPANTPVTYGYLESFKEKIKEELKQEIINQLTEDGAFETEQIYKEVSAVEGQLIILAPDSEVIYRGGGASAITNGFEEGEGIIDMSFDREIFSGEALEYGHIYYPSSSESKKAILVTGTKAYFTIRGSYEIG